MRNTLNENLILQPPGRRDSSPAMNVMSADQALDEACAVLARGGLVAIPTETVYGLAADAANGEAVARIFEAKGRPRFNPLIAHVADMEMAQTVARFDPLSTSLSRGYWPGPLTLVLPRAATSTVHPLAAAGLDTVAVRMPAGFARDLLRAYGRPIVAPSANSSGRISATSAQHVADDLGERVDLIVDGGATPVGVESTIVKVEDGRLLLLRPGGVPVEGLESFTGLEVERPGQGQGASKVEAPGMLASHYAPRARVRMNARELQSGEALLAFGPSRAANASLSSATLNLSPAGDLREAASNLFAFMQELDRTGTRIIAVEPIPDHGLGEAINDRLSRAAAERPGETHGSDAA